MLPLGAVVVVVLLLLLLGISGRLLIRRDLLGRDAINVVGDGDALVNREEVVKVGNMLAGVGEDQVVVVVVDEEDGDKGVLDATASTEEGDGAKVKVKGGAALLTFAALAEDALLLLLMVVRWSVRSAVVVVEVALEDCGRAVVLLLRVLLEVVLPEREKDLAVDVDLTLLINESCCCWWWWW